MFREELLENFSFEGKFNLNGLQRGKNFIEGKKKSKKIELYFKSLILREFDRFITII